MPKLRETLQSLELLCWNATEDKIEEYLKSYPHLRNPATIDLLRQTIKTWERIQMLETLLEAAQDSKQKQQLIFKINSLTKTWLTMLGNLGITFTRQQYKSSKKRVQPPIERLEMLKKKGKKDVE